MQKPALTLDAGNLLFRQATVSASQELISASEIMDIYREMAYDAVAVGPNDIAAGQKFLQDAAERGFPWLSANIVDGNQKPVFKPAMVVERAGLAIGIIGLTGPTNIADRGIAVADWRKALAEQLTALEHSADLIVVLSNLLEQDNAELTSTYPQVHILVTANRHQGNIQPQIVKSTLVTQTHSQGKYLGMLDLDWHPGRDWGKDFAQENLLLHDRLGIFDRQLLRAERQKQAGRSGVASEERVRQLRKERQKLVEQIDSARRRMDQLGAEKDSLNSFQGTFFPMKKETPDDQEILKRVRRIKERINSHNQEPGIDRQSRNPGHFAEPDKPLTALTGSLRCGSCHTAQTEFWKTTRHDRAYQSLLQQKQNYNLDCLPCHVTHSAGTDEEGLAREKNLLDLSPILHGVGCESCHGPGDAHAADPTQVSPKKEVAESVCLTCHTGEHSPGFAYTVEIAKVSCPAD